MRSSLSWFALCEEAHRRLMHEHLKEIPVERRPKMLPLLPGGASYFRVWRSLRWFLVLLVPVAGSAVSLWSRKHGIGLSLIVGVLGIFVAASLFVDLCSGMTSSNWGTYFRQTEPKRYWLQVAVVAFFYLAISCAGYFA